MDSNILFTSHSSNLSPRLDECFLRRRYEQDRILLKNKPKEMGELARLSAGVSTLLNEVIGIVPEFKKLKLTKAVIDSWIVNTGLLSEKEIEEDLVIIKNFLLSCSDIFTDDIDRESIIPIMKLFFKERFVWQCDEDVEKLKRIIDRL